MHIDLSTTNETQERDAAAKRTSEGTQLAARLAQTDRYIPIKRSKFVYRPEDQAAANSQQPDGARQRTLPLTLAETKAEQARLLTLLRSLQPVLVVDQLCKALAFFGEVSGAQSSADGVFPVSAEANGSGSLFVGWLAEIFPALGQGTIPSAEHPPLKRPRGRPKGSKNAKGKKDKLARKRFDPAAPSANATGDSRASSGLVGESAVDDSWVDVDDDVVENEARTNAYDSISQQPSRGQSKCFRHCSG
ncbi:DNA binding domain with preference for a t rich regions-like protein [Colletotrichum tofieldiae]|nr:DNA binding domain with preference for a t rich regions-like protein [Colletotrichum tofieldiae]GKT75191.1 DNA binding domain with preference for a t rich regions-like protein [Colletotrichum tofieldiae]GKT82833.1 DNA binding domain with preference for a t rich regions-like protein [Colletotrichum tofieldiae]